MKTEHFAPTVARGSSLAVASVLIVAAAAVAGGCNTMSVIEKDAAAGINGSFETVRDGLPVNWFFIYPEALRLRTYEVAMDSPDAIEGARCLKFVVHETDPSRDIWRNPGMFNTVDARPGERYRVSLQLRSERCSFLVKVHSEDHPREYEEVVVDSTAPLEGWQYFELEYTIPPGYEALGVYLHIWTPGILWVDDVRIERISDDRVRLPKTP